MTIINVNLQQSHDAFVNFIAAANQQLVDAALLKDVYQEKMDRITQYWSVLTQLATAGLEDQLSPLLNTLLQEWAIKEGAELLLRYHGTVVDPSHPGLQQ